MASNTLKFVHEKKWLRISIFYRNIPLVNFAYAVLIEQLLGVHSISTPFTLFLNKYSYK